ncbi:hypothetical protein ACFV30_37365 [Streptomyces sp. NPDC059752]|uniref:hypothetical protein n=1 Tax=unclassified Streptomyces TaxID=2593676 RepID=UPI00365395DA
MSAFHVLEGKAFTNRDFEAVTLPTPWQMYSNWKSCIHADPEVQAFRTTAPVRGPGDYDLHVSCLKREDIPDVGFEHFIAHDLREWLDPTYRQDPKNAPKQFHFRERYPEGRLEVMPTAEEAASYVESLPYYRAPVEVLWDFSNFGELQWDRVERSVQLPGRPGPRTDDADAPAVDGSMLLPTIYANVGPDLMQQDIEAIRERQLDRLNHIPQMRRGSLLRHAMAEEIDEELQPLSALCRKHGTFGEAVLPGAFDSITGFFLKAYDGNFKEAFIETEMYFYCISLATS